MVSTCSKDMEAWQTELLRLMPLLCHASSSLGSHAPSSLSIMVLVMQRYLTAFDWLPCLQSNLDMTTLLEGAFQQLAGCPGEQSRMRSFSQWMSKLSSSMSREFYPIACFGIT